MSFFFLYIYIYTKKSYEVIVSFASSLVFPSHTIRQGNVVAHTLAKKIKAGLSFPLLVGMESVPSDLNNVVVVDLPAS